MMIYVARNIAFSLFAVMMSLIILSPYDAEAAIAFVQKISGTTSSAGSLALKLPANVTAGNLLVVSVSGWPNLPAVTAVTDSLGNSYSIAGTVEVVYEGSYSAMYYAWNVKGGADTITFQTIDSGQISMIVAEFSGVDTISPLDKAVGAWALGGVASSGAMTPAVVGSLIIGSGTQNGNTVTTAGPGFTMIDSLTEDSDTHQPLAMEYLVLDGIKQVIPIFYLATPYPWTQNGVIFKPASQSVTDTVAPTVTAFTIPATSTSLTVPINSFTATDNIGVYGYLLTESSVAPPATVGPWSSTVPASYTFYYTATGNKTLYAWARDAAGNVSASRSASITISAVESDSYSIWPVTATPETVDAGSDNPVELGVKFKSDISGSITGIRFYKAVNNIGTHVANLWTSSGSRIATATFDSETASGWQQANFATPVAISAGTTYVASYHTSVGHYSADRNFFASTKVYDTPLHAISNASSAGGNGVFVYGSSSAFPSQSWSSTNYWVDVVLSSGGSTPPPVTTGLEQIAAEATGTTIFTTQAPVVYENDATYELGTKFRADVNGQVTQVRIYTNSQEGGSHTARIWRVSDQTLLGGPYTWNITAGSVGWKNFTLPSAVDISANTDYIVSVSNSSDRYYAAQNHGFDAPIVNGSLQTYVGSGVYAESLGVMPTSTWENSSYFRDVVFVPQP